MARGSTIYRTHIEISNVDRNIYADEQRTVARHPSETAERMVIRLLAFGIRYDPSIEFGRGVSATDEPALWKREGGGRIVEWIDVGQPDAKRLVKASRKSDSCMAFAFGDGAERWHETLLRETRLLDHLSVARIDDEFTRAVGETLDRQIRWSVTVAEGTVFLTTESGTFETTPETWMGNPLG